MKAKRSKLIGRIVDIRRNQEQYAGHWGIVQAFDGDRFYTVAGGSIGDLYPVFTRDEFVVRRETAAERREKYVQGVRRARDRAEARRMAGENFLAKYRIGWDPSTWAGDGRAGSCHGWTAAGVYVGRFRSHALAGKAGAVVTYFQGIWFDWRGDDSL
jgi:hypothetical protein